jgi:hypothetical protein
MPVAWQQQTLHKPRVSKSVPSFSWASRVITWVVSIIMAPWVGVKRTYFPVELVWEQIESDVWKTRNPWEWRKLGLEVRPWGVATSRALPLTISFHGRAHLHIRMHLVSDGGKCPVLPLKMAWAAHEGVSLWHCGVLKYKCTYSLWVLTLTFLHELVSLLCLFRM